MSNNVINARAEELCLFVFEMFDSWSDDKAREAAEYYNSYLNDSAYTLNDSRSWGLTAEEIKAVIAAAEKIWVEDYSE